MNGADAAAPRAPLAPGHRHMFVVLAVVAALLPTGVDGLLGIPLQVGGEPFLGMFQAFWTSVPFCHVAVARPALRRPRATGAAALAVVVGFWAMVVQSALHSRADGGGADIGLGCILFVLPLLVGAVMVGVEAIPLHRPGAPPPQ